MSNILENNICYACHGCENICPFEALTFKASEDGIEYPNIVLDKCNNCSVCLKKCKKKLLLKKPIRCFLLESKEEEEILEASSGGAFFKLASAFLKFQNAIVYGVAYNGDLVVKHEAGIEINNIKKFRKSKYVQSDMQGCFENIKSELEEGKYILFSGTPCQIAGLKKYLDCDYSNLLTIDLICTGVFKPIVFRKFLGLHNNMNITYFDWRYKHSLKNGNWNIMDSAIFSNGKIIKEESAVLLKKLYGKKYGFKEACYNCEYAKEERCADITLGDFWGETSRFGNKPNKGTSVLLINNEKGQRLFNAIDRTTVNILSIDFSKIVKQNPALSKHTLRPINNDMFLEELKNVDFRKVLKKYTKDSLNSQIKMFIASILPLKIVKIIRKRKF